MYSIIFLLSLLGAASAELGCKFQTQSKPNPIAKHYPNNTTGTINGTIAILPIPYSLARSIVPKQYPILKDAVQEILPAFPQDMYPALLETEIDHDVRDGSVGISDFSRASISFPFVDRLNDGYTSMTYGLHILISATNPVAIAGTVLYGYEVTPASFDPPCDAYAFTNGTSKGEVFFNAYRGLGEQGKPQIATRLSPLNATDKSPYSIEFWRNVTNQPQFSANTLLCDNYIRFFNSSVSVGTFAPTPVKGEVTAVKPFFAETTKFKGVYGLNVDNAFLENNYMSCESLQGYHGTGSGD